MSGLQLLSAPVVFAMISAICTNLNSVDSDHICATGPASCNELQWPPITPYLVDCSIGSWYQHSFSKRIMEIPNLCFLNSDFQISYTSLRWCDSGDSEIHMQMFYFCQIWRVECNFQPEHFYCWRQATHMKEPCLLLIAKSTNWTIIRQ